MKPNPTLELLETFAGYFGVSLDTFASPHLAAERAEQLRFIALMRDRQDVIAVLMRGGDEVTRRAVEALVNIEDSADSRGEDSTDDGE
jgi:transcriptional regulator with XRE-family HTH domain